MGRLIRAKNMQSDERMTIGVLARGSGVRVRTLRFYEEQGLITPLGRTSKGYRLYGPAALDDLAFVKGAKRLGLHLDQIGDLLQIRREGQCPCKRTRELVSERLQEAEAALREIRDLRDHLRRTVREWEAEPSSDARSPCRSVAHGGA